MTCCVFALPVQVFNKKGRLEFPLAQLKNQLCLFLILVLLVSQSDKYHHHFTTKKYVVI
jgi:hypothetical protein